MKILTIANNYYPSIENGMDRHVYEHSTKQGLMGHEVHVLTYEILKEKRKIYPLYQKEKIDNVFVHRIPVFHQTKNTDLNLHYLNISLFSETINLFMFENFDIIHCHDIRVGIAGFLLSKALNIPLITTVHYSFGQNENQYGTYLKDIEKFVLLNSDGIISVSGSTMKEINRLYHISDTIKQKTIPNGINLNDFNPNKNNIDLELKFELEKLKYILYVGRLDPEKGVDFLLEGYSKINTEFPNIKLILVGEGSSEDLLRNQVQEMGISQNVIFLGYLKGNSLKTVYRYAHLVVMPSLYEPFGLVALEAMSFGVPLIATNVGGLKEIPINKESGIIINPRSSQEIENALRTLLTDCVIYNHLKMNSVKRVCLFDWKDVAERTLDFYTELKVNHNSNTIL